MGNSDRQPHLTATVLDQDFLDQAQDNLVNQLEMILELEVPTGTLYLSDRNKYVGSRFYEARLKFPEITRTVGEFLSPSLEFSSIDLEINNADSKYNNILPSGADYASWIGNSVVVKIGLRDVASTYTTIFEGFITAEAGIDRTTSTIRINARNRFDKINQAFPRAVFDTTVYTLIEDSLANANIPYIYGNWTTRVTDSAAVPAIVVNGEDFDVNGETSNTNNIKLVIAQHPLVNFDTSKVYWRTSEADILVAAADITAVAGDNSTFEIIQDTGNTQDNDGENLKYSRGTEFFVRVIGKDLGAYDDNIVEIARDILITFGGLTAGDFDSSWDTFRDKAAPAESAIANIKARAWLGEPQNVVEYTLSLLEQVRLEFFINRDLKLSLTSLHFDEFESNPSHTIRNWDVEEKSFNPAMDERLNINRARGEFNFLPSEDKNFEKTSVYRNSAAITAIGQDISKSFVYPNLYESADVASQVQETLKITSSYFEILTMNLTWRSLLLDVGDFVKMDVKIQGTEFDVVPCLVRSVGYNPEGIKIPLRAWSFQMMPIPGYTPGFSGTTGGSTATITKEV